MSALRELWDIVELPTLEQRFQAMERWRDRWVVTASVDQTIDRLMLMSVRDEKSFRDHLRGQIGARLGKLLVETKGVLEETTPPLADPQREERLYSVRLLLAEPKW